MSNMQASETEVKGLHVQLASKDHAVTALHAQLGNLQQHLSEGKHQVSTLQEDLAAAVKANRAGAQVSLAIFLMRLP